jgi:hypothetical protein
MADEVDVANEYYEKMLRSSIEACKDGELHIDGSGECLWCGDAVESVDGVVGRWCSIECREDMVKYG